MALTEEDPGVFPQCLHPRTIANSYASTKKGRPTVRCRECTRRARKTFAWRAMQALARAKAGP